MDASGTVTEHALHAAMHRMAQVGVKIANTNMVIAELQNNWANETAGAVGALYASRLPGFGYAAALLNHHVTQA